MLIDALTNSGPLPTLELSMRFAAQRQRLVAHNIANIDTPDFRPFDASPRGFQDTLREAIDDRRARTGGLHGELRFKPTSELELDGAGELRINPRTPSTGVLFHDRNNRDVERLMQALAETTGAFRAASDLYRAHVNILNTAISERV